MNKEQVTGKLDELKGKAKEKIGEITNNPDTEAEGLVDQGKGKLKQAYGDVKEAVKKTTTASHSASSRGAGIFGPRFSKQRLRHHLNREGTL